MSLEDVEHAIRGVRGHLRRYRPNHPEGAWDPSAPVQNSEMSMLFDIASPGMSPEADAYGGYLPVVGGFDLWSEVPLAFSSPICMLCERTQPEIGWTDESIG